jgi:peptidoglycan hydrolase FlgJ
MSSWVLSAADPSRASLAAQRLSALAGSDAAGPDFSADLERAASAPNSIPAPLANAADARSRLAEIPGGPDKLGPAKTQFEAMMLNSFVGEILPKDASIVFGQGTAGDMWRSMLAEQVSLQIAKSASSDSPGACSPPTNSAPAIGRRIPVKRRRPPARRRKCANILSAPVGAELDNGAVMFAGRKRT